MLIYLTTQIYYIIFMGEISIIKVVLLDLVKEFVRFRIQCFGIR